MLSACLEGNQGRDRLDPKYKELFLNLECLFAILDPVDVKGNACKD